MTNRTRSLVIAAMLGIGAIIGLAPVATANPVGVPEPRVNASGGRGACVAVHDVGGWCLVNPFDDLP